MARASSAWTHHYCLADSSKRAPTILIFSIAMHAEYQPYVKSIPTFAPTFYGYIISVLASVESDLLDIFGCQNPQLERSFPRSLKSTLALP